MSRMSKDFVMKHVMNNTKYLYVPLKACSSVLVDCKLL